jgi:hypothetical protein
VLIHRNLYGPQHPLNIMTLVLVIMFHFYFCRLFQTYHSMSALKLSNYFSQWGMFSLSWCLCFRFGPTLIFLQWLMLPTVKYEPIMARLWKIRTFNSHIFLCDLDFRNTINFWYMYLLRNGTILIYLLSPPL